MVVRNNVPTRYRKPPQQQLLSVVVLGVAIVSAAVLLSRSPARTQAQAAVGPVVESHDTVTVPVPAVPVSPGTRIREIDFKRVTYPAHQIPDGALIDISGFLDFVAVTSLPAGMPLYAANLKTYGGTTNPVIEKIPEGMRAMTVNVDATSSVEGWAGSGSIVDVLLVREDRTTVVAEKVKILSSERSVRPTNTEAGPVVPSTTTLLVTQQQCLAINTAVNLGKIAFALRSIGDSGKWRQPHYEAIHLANGPQVNSEKSRVNGYVTFSNSKSETRSFALANGKWIQSDVKPQGFFVSGDTTNEETPPTAR